ncbi:c-type cytochrome [Ensifer aridi]|uniref:c-type cytochrome n=1 Tax=Ensifer aridi TaxID=1708715 RepID=UPI00111BF2FD|nr:cytochrome c [Ensifer aridi]
MIGFKSNILACVVSAGLMSLAGHAPASSESPRTLYLLRCSGCHGVDGSGSKTGRVPGLTGISKLLLHPDGRLFLANVPGIENSGLSDGQIAFLLNWALDFWRDRSFNQLGPPLTGNEISRLKKIPVDDLTRLRDRIAADLAAQGINLGSNPAR